MIDAERYYECLWGVQYRGSTQITKGCIPHRYWTPALHSRYPPRASYYPPLYSRHQPTVLMISPILLNTPMVLKISPTFIMISQHLSWYPLRYWTSPTVLKISPRTPIMSPQYWTPPWYWAFSPAPSSMVLNTHYTGCESRIRSCIFEETWCWVFSYSLVSFNS